MINVTIMTKKHTHVFRRSRIRRQCAVAGVCAIMAFGQFQAHAQTDIPGSADSAKIGAEKKRQEFLNRPLDNSPPLAGGGIVSETAPEGADTIIIPIRGFQIQGSTVYSPAELENLYAEYKGKEVPLAAVWTVAARITQKYRADGYFLTKAVVPPQEIANNTPRIEIIEGYIADIDFKSADAVPRYIHRAAEDLKLRRPIKVKVLEEFLMMLNDLPQSSFRGVLEPDRQLRRGAVDLIVVAERKSPSYTASVSNFGSKYIGPVLADIGMSASLMPYQELGLGLSKSLPFEEMTQISASYTWNQTLRDQLTLKAEIGSTFPGENLREDDLESRTQEYAAQIRHTFEHLRSSSLFGFLEMGVRRSDSDILGDDLSKDRLRFIRTGFSLSRQDETPGITSADLHVTRGLGIFGASEKSDINTTREASGSDFTKAEITLSRLQMIGEDWSVLSAVSGQMASRSLSSSEEFGFGGSSFGRAYDNSEITGDHGLAGLVEVRYNDVPQIGPEIDITPYMFYDFGKVWNKNSGQASNITASSAGVGLYTNIQHNLNANVFLGKPLTKTIATPLRAGGDDWQIRFQMQRNF